MPQLPSGQFNPNDYNDMRDFAPIPPGKYIAAIVNSELKDTSTGGIMLVLYGEILAGPYTGKGFVTRLNLVNATPTAVKIANEELATITRACKLGPIQSSEQLHGIAFLVTLSLVPGDGQYGPKNEATFYTTTEGYDRNNIPVNPEPDETTLKIIQGIITAGGDSGGGGKPAGETKVPDAPAGFSNEAPAQTAAAPANAAPAAPDGFSTAPADSNAQTQAAPAATQTAPATGAAAPPW